LEHPRNIVRTGATIDQIFRLVRAGPQALKVLFVDTFFSDCTAFNVLPKLAERPETSITFNGDILVRMTLNRPNYYPIEQQESVTKDAVVKILNALLVDAHPRIALNLVIRDSTVRYLPNILLGPKSGIVWSQKNRGNRHLLHFELIHVQIGVPPQGHGAHKFTLQIGTAKPIRAPVCASSTDSIILFVSSRRGRSTIGGF
jgi:hypothetical protein